LKFFKSPSVIILAIAFSSATVSAQSIGPAYDQQFDLIPVVHNQSSFLLEVGDRVVVDLRPVSDSGRVALAQATAFSASMTMVQHNGQEVRITFPTPTQNSNSIRFEYALIQGQPAGNYLFSVTTPSGFRPVPQSLITIGAPRSLPIGLSATVVDHYGPHVTVLGSFAPDAFSGDNILPIGIFIFSDTGALTTYADASSGLALASQFFLHNETKLTLDTIFRPGYTATVLMKNAGKVISSSTNAVLPVSLSCQDRHCFGGGTFSILAVGK
jgi:hypothetical protein